MKAIYFLCFGIFVCESACLQSAEKDLQKAAVTSSSEIDSKPPLNEEFSTDYLMGKFDPAMHPAFAEIEPALRDKEVRYLRKEVLEAFRRMHAAASNEGIHLVIISATRNFEVQKRIWENKWMGRTLLEGGLNAARDIHSDTGRARKILEYSSMPGTSRHHWGTDLDINSLDNEWFERGEGLALYRWMQAHAAEFGFCQPYTRLGSDRKSGYLEEKWHWTYMPLSIKLTELAKQNLKDDLISGFAGSQTASEIKVIEKYVLGISPACILKQ